MCELNAISLQTHEQTMWKYYIIMMMVVMEMFGLASGWSYACNFLSVCHFVCWGLGPRPKTNPSQEMGLYTKSPTVQDAFQPIPGLISCAG